MLPGLATLLPAHSVHLATLPGDLWELATTWPGQGERLPPRGNKLPEEQGPVPSWQRVPQGSSAAGFGSGTLVAHRVGFRPTPKTLQVLEAPAGPLTLLLTHLHSLSPLTHSLSLTTYSLSLPTTLPLHSTLGFFFGGEEHSSVVMVFTTGVVFPSSLVASSLPPSAVSASRRVNRFSSRAWASPRRAFRPSRSICCRGVITC